jgi:DNA-directed RNA polymerase subunit RPC12/RpoP
MSEYIYYRCPSCLTKYQSALEKSGSPINCPSCRHYFLIPSKSTFIPDQDQHQQPKLIDCLDCGSSISSSAFFCMKCGRPSPLAAERAKTQGCAMMLLIYVLSGLVLNEFLKWAFLSISNKS